MNPIIPKLHLFAGCCAAHKRFQRCWSRGLAIALSIGISALLGVPGVVGAEDWHEAFFSEPLSGKKVTHYEIELPIERGQRQTFRIPDDCGAAVRAINQGSAFKGSIVDRRFWQKVESDCRYHDFLYSRPQQVITDHVSAYDFMNAHLSDLPIDRRCAESGADPQQSRCNATITNGLGMLRHFPLAAPLSTPPDNIECIRCELRNGLFRGYIFVGEDGIRCGTDVNAPSLRLIAVDHADINGDGFLDAVLRFVPIGPGSSRLPMILPLTRMTADGPFIPVPEPTFGTP